MALINLTDKKQMELAITHLTYVYLILLSTIYYCKGLAAMVSKGMYFPGVRVT